MSSVVRVSNYSNCFFLNEFDLIKIVLRDATEHNRAVAEVRLNKGKIKCFECS